MDMRVFCFVLIFALCKSLDHPILTALFDSNFEEADRLIAVGNDPNEVDQEYGWTPLQVVSYNGNLEFARTLLNAGARIDDACNDGWTPLIIASREGHFELSKYLIESGADIFTVSRTALSAHGAAVLSGNHDLLEYIEQKIHDSEDGKLYINQRGHLSSLLPAAHSGDAYAVAAVLKEGSNPNQRSSSDGITPLMLASTVGADQAMKVLLEGGADPDLKDQGGWTALMYSVQYVSVPRHICSDHVLIALHFFHSLILLFAL
jgi:ankyrin repeat protein